MARSLGGSSLSMQHIVSSLPASFLTFAAIFAVFSAVIFLCGAHQGMMSSLMGREKMKTVRLGGGDNKKKTKQRVMERMKSSKAVLMSKMISWRKVEEDDEDEDDVVWKKTIIRGEKCRPLDFSGKILYDADGNLLSDSD